MYIILITGIYNKLVLIRVIRGLIRVISGLFPLRLCVRCNID